jgi:hypothetical protein
VTSGVDDVTYLYCAGTTCTPNLEIGSSTASTTYPVTWNSMPVDGTYRVMPKAVPNSTEPLALSAVGSSSPTLTKFKPDSDRQRWLIVTP